MRNDRGAGGFGPAAGAEGVAAEAEICYDMYQHAGAGHRRLRGHMKRPEEQGLFRI